MTHLKITRRARARARAVKKIGKSDIGHPTFIRLFKIRFHSSSLNHEVKSMMMVSDNGLGRARICKVCGKEGSWKHIRDHIEANHIDGISIPCDLCGKSFKSRNNLSAHKSRHT